ncbi:MAG: hypothetical protein QG646_1350 [Euryarchaeota archaeon]|nr:hypothetical protein [Euryarchaeota archaeon]
MTKTNQEDLQGKVRKELSALELIGIPGISTLRNKPLQELNESEKQPTESIQNNIPDTKSIQSDNVTKSITTEERADIKSNYHKFDNDVSDILASYQTPIEQVIYHRLYRLSYGYSKNTCQVGMGALAKACNISSSEKTVRKAIKGLIEKGHIAIVDEHNNSKLGTKYRIFLPLEINGIESRTIVKNTVVENTTVNNTTVFNTTRTTVNPTVVKNTTVPSMPMNKQSTPTVVNSTVVDFTGNIYNTIYNKDTLSLRAIITSFYKGIGQENISKKKRERAENNIKELEEEGFSLEDIAFVVKWTIENSREKPYDFSLIKDTIGQAMAAKKEIEAKETKRIENERLKAQKEEDEKRIVEIQEKIKKHKEGLNEVQRLELRNEALEEIRKTKGIKEEFITELFIEAKENEIIRKQLGIQVSE